MLSIRTKFSLLSSLFFISFFLLPKNTFGAFVVFDTINKVGGQGGGGFGVVGKAHINVSNTEANPEALKTAVMGGEGVAAFIGNRWPTNGDPFPFPVAIVYNTPSNPTTEHRRAQDNCYKTALLAFTMTETDANKKKQIAFNMNTTEPVTAYVSNSALYINVTLPNCPICLGGKCNTAEFIGF